MAAVHNTLDRTADVYATATDSSSVSAPRTQCSHFSVSIVTATGQGRESRPGLLDPEAGRRDRGFACRWRQVEHNAGVPAKHRVESRIGSSGLQARSAFGGNRCCPPRTSPRQDQDRHAVLIFQTAPRLHAVDRYPSCTRPKLLAATAMMRSAPVRRPGSIS
jgi:hypothetical protein